MKNDNNPKNRNKVTWLEVVIGTKGALDSLVTLLLVRWELHADITLHETELYTSHKKELDKALTYIVAMLNYRTKKNCLRINGTPLEATPRKFKTLEN